MITSRNVVTLGLLLVVAGSCTKDFDRFDFDDPAETGGTGARGGTGGTGARGGTGGSVGGTGAQGTTTRNTGGTSTSMAGKGGTSATTTGKTGGSGGKLSGGAGTAMHDNGGRSGPGEPAMGAGRPGNSGPPGDGGRGMGASGMSGTAGKGKGGSPQGGTVGASGAPGCPKDQVDCGAGCVPMTTPEHCGSCDNVCTEGFTCAGATCVCAGDTDCVAPGVNGEAGQAGAMSAGGAASSG